MRRVVGRVLTFAASLAFVGLLAWPVHAQQEFPKLPSPHSAPEIDPAALGSAIALLTGGGLLLKSRRASRASR